MTQIPWAYGICDTYTTPIEGSEARSVQVDARVSNRCDQAYNKEIGSTLRERLVKIGAKIGPGMAGRSDSGWPR
jgi:hypothetical protein